jgi:hypothetical protein
MDIISKPRNVFRVLHHNQGTNRETDWTAGDRRSGSTTLVSTLFLDFLASQSLQADTFPFLATTLFVQKGNFAFFPLFGRILAVLLHLTLQLSYFMDLDEVHTTF